ncbi:glycosyltransferase [Rugosimonospora africana]|uniref:Glycosyl transferase family 2 n=1 Tax=Rugosimonospora africana TaxID=556532 RepID=A0A8J3R316_9ACTN|nr:glycosyltransferase [Rugosimonospora africana]GIH20753.1 glycosyl transferase family 2 [Rugosimonospora africana]
MLIFRVLAAVASLAWVWLALARGMFWRTDVRLPRGRPPHHETRGRGPQDETRGRGPRDETRGGTPPDETPQTAPPEREPQRWPTVAIVVPARDEAAVLPDSLSTLVRQEYPGPVRVILVDDNSTDGTRTLVASRWPAVTIVDPGEPPPGWAGKLWALTAGVAEAGEVDYLLLTDADIAHRPDSLASLVRAAEEHRLDLVSQMARLRVSSPWERLVVPAFVYFFALLYPFRWSNRPGTRTAAAAGGCSLVRRSALERGGGLAEIRGAVIDDVALARVLKGSGARTFLGLADRVDSIRPYPDLGTLWRMVSRSAYAQLRHSLALLAGTVVGLALIFLVPLMSIVVGAATGDVPTLVLGAATWLLMAGTYTPMLRYYGQPWPAALAMPFTATLYLAMTVDSAVQHYRGRGAAWKGRTYTAG